MATPATIQNHPAETAPIGSGGIPAPLRLVLVITFLGSVGSGAVTSGIYFITKSGLGYGRLENLWLAVAFGVTYIAAALGAGPAIRSLAARFRRSSSRGVLAGVLVAMGIVCQLPLLAKRVPVFEPVGVGRAVWAMVLVYSPASGALWPIVESYLSGGRRERDLRRAVGRFNIVWSSAIVAAFWGMAPLLERRPFLILCLLGVLHLVMVAFVLFLPREPARHTHSEHQHPAVYGALLELFRVLLFTSYLVLSALGPIQPIILERSGVAVAWQLPLASVWLTARVIGFALLERWHGWHGTWWMPWTGLALIVTGFVLTVAAPALPHASGWAIASGLAVMGSGVALIYCGALYYAMEVGSAGVDAGGKHEAVIGTGYALGPALGLVALALARRGTPTDEPTDPDAFRVWTIGLTVGAACMLGAWGWRLARKRARAD